MQSTQRAAPRRARPGTQPLEPVQILSRVLAVLLAIVPLTLVLTSTAWRPLQESTGGSEDRVGAASAAYGPADDRVNRPLPAPREGPFAED